MEKCVTVSYSNFKTVLFFDFFFLLLNVNNFVFSSFYLSIVFSFKDFLFAVKKDSLRYYGILNSPKCIYGNKN